MTSRPNQTQSNQIKPEERAAAHHIVHQADRSEKRGHGHQQKKSLSRNAVRGWVSCVHKALDELNQQFCGKRQ